MESGKRINWLSVFIKLIIMFIFILIIIWLIAKIFGNNKLSEAFINNINNMEKVSIEYFKTIDLPLEKGKNIKITLGELLEKELIVSNKDDSASSCDAKKSYSEITREKNKYVVKTTLKCGKEKDTIKSDFPLEYCKNCNQTAGANINEDKENLNSKDSNVQNKTTYYEYFKETTSYTKWMRGSVTGENIENKYEYYSIAYDTYYTLGVLPADKKSITYTLKLTNVPNDKYYFTKVEDVSDYVETEEENYLNENDVSIYKGSIPSISKDIKKYSLNQENVKYKLSPYYRNGVFYIKATINLNSTEGVETYYDKQLKERVYLLPLKIKVKFASNIVSEKKPIGEYDTISYYRYVTTNKETIWSSEPSLDGYTKTGNIQVK